MGLNAGKKQKYEINGRIHELTQQEYECVRLYFSGQAVVGGSYTECYKKVFNPKKETTDGALYAMASRLFNRPHCKEAVSDFALQVSSPRWVHAKLQQLAENAGQDRDKLKAVELIGKTSAMFVDKVAGNFEVSRLMSADEEDDL